MTEEQVISLLDSSDDSDDEVAVAGGGASEQQVPYLLDTSNESDDDVHTRARAPSLAAASSFEQSCAIYLHNQPHRRLLHKGGWHDVHAL